jgi:hypothetical protein
MLLHKDLILLLYHNMYHGNHSSKVKNIQYLCDKFSGASVIYSLRRLRKDYTGPLIKVSDSTGTNQFDIYTKHDTKTGFDYIDWNYILNKFSSGIVYVVTWYDQSGNGFNLTNATIINCPYIVDYSDPLINQGDNRNPFYNLNGYIGLAATQKRLINSSINITTPITYFTIQNIGSTRKTGVVFDSYNNSQCVLYNSGLLESPNYRYTIANGTNVKNVKEIVALQMNLTSGVLGDQSNLNIDYGYGNNETLSTNNLDGLSVFNIRGNPNPIVGGYDWNGLIYEVIIYQGNLRDKIELIRKQILKDYSIFSVLNFRQ